MGKLTSTRTISVPIVAVALAAMFPPALAAGSGEVEPVPSPALCDTPNPRPMSRVRPGPYEVGKTEVVELASDYDGEVIQIGVVHPDVPASQKTPVIVFASPYLDHDFAQGDLKSCELRLTRNFVQHGYTIGFVSVRGTGDSGGCSDLMGNAERADLDQAITWFGTQKWSNGRVGMIGVSYDGSTPWEVAATGNKYLKTIVPISGVNDIYHLMYKNGAPEFRGPVLLNALYYTYPASTFDPMGRRPAHWVKTIVCPEAFKGFYASIHSSATGERDPLGYWGERSSRPGVEKKYRGSILLARCLQDWNVDPSHDFPWVTELDRKGIYVKYVLGQWAHAWPDSSSSNEIMEEGEPVRWDWADLLLNWWDRWLKNDRSSNIGPGAQVQDSAGEWRNESTWPPADAKAVDYFLTADDRLSEKPSSKEASHQIVFDANPSRQANRMCVCARFSLGPVEKEFRFAGIPELSATVVPQGPGGHLAATLYASENETLSGAELLGWGMVDLRFAEGGEKAGVVVPGQAMKVTVPLEPLDAVVPKGSDLVLLVGQSGYGSGPIIPDRSSPSAIPLELQVGGDKTKITLLTFTRGRNAFFRPPVKPRPAA